MLGSSSALGAWPERKRPGPNFLIGLSTLKPVIGYLDEIFFETDTQTFWVGTGVGWAFLSLIPTLGGALGDLMYVNPGNSTGLGLIPAIAAGHLLRSAGVATPPAFSAFTVPNSVLRGGVLIASADDVFSALAIAAAGKVLISDGTDLIYSTAQYPLTVLAGDLLAASANDVVAALAIASAGRFLRSNGTLPLWSGMTLPNTIAAGQILRASADDVVGTVHPYWHGQCRLNFVASDNIRLDPFNGDKLIINGKCETIPAVGVSIDETSVVADTTYFVYAFMNAGVMELEFSTTAHSIDAATGVRIKTGDATRTLVGMVRTDTGPVFAFSATKRWVISYFNRRNIQCEASFSTARTTNSGTLVELNTEIIIQWLNWGDEAVSLALSGDNSNNTAGTAMDTTHIRVDTLISVAVTRGTQTAANQNLPNSCSAHVSLPEGWHLASVYAFVSAGTGSWSTNNKLTAMVRG